MATNPWKPGTKKGLIADFVLRGLDRLGVFNALKTMVQSQTEPMVYKRNTPEGRKPKSLSYQLQDLWADIGRVIVYLHNRGQTATANLDHDQTPDFNDPDMVTFAIDDTDDPNPPLVIDSDDLDDSADTADSPEPMPDIPNDKPAIVKGSKLRTEIEFYLNEVQRIRKWCNDRAVSGQRVDSISMRPISEGKKAIMTGKVPARAMLYAMAMHWPEATRREAGIADFDFRTISEDMGEGCHELLGYLLILAECRIPIMLVGPAGSGKSYLAQQISDVLDVDYGETPMTAGATPSWLLGSWTPDQNEPYKSRPFVDCYGSGGVFNFEEIDRADPNMLIVVNNALAQDRLYNPVSGIRIPKHEDFIALATANTFGLGGGRDYTGAERLDLATIDRFRMGRAFIDIDEKLERYLALKGVK